MACKEASESVPRTASVVRDGTSQTRTDYCVDKVKEFVSFFATQSRVWLQSKHKSFSLIEFQLLREISRCSEITANQLALQLKINLEDLNGMLDDLHKRGLVSKTAFSNSNDPTNYSLTELGKSKQQASDIEFRNNITKTLGTLSATKQTCLVDAVNTATTLLSWSNQPNLAYSIRPHQSGDMGWIVYRHGVLYLQEYGWSEQLEALVAEITAKFLRNYNPKLDRCLIAERNGEIVGSIFLMNTTKEMAQLRLLLVEPSARGLGIGSRLVEECILFARQAGYRKIMLWTHTILHSALRIYKAKGFQLVSEQSHDSFGQEVVGQTWELEL